MKHQTAIHAALCTALVLLGTRPTLAASTDLYLKLPTVPGLSTNEGRKNWHEIDSVQWGIGVGISAPSLTRDREVSEPSVSEVVWTQHLDASYPKLLGASFFNSSAQPGARFEWMSSGNSRISKPYLSLLLGDNSYVTGVSLSNDSVSASIGSSRYSWTYDPAGLGRSGQTSSVVIDLAKGTASGNTSRAPTSFVGDEAAATSADTRIYMHVGTGPAAIAGDSRKQGYENWIELQSAQMGVGRGFSFASGSGSSLSPTSVSELTFSQMLDGSFTPMLAALASGKTLNQVVIEYVRDGAEERGPLTYMQIKLEDVLISSMSLSGADDTPTVTGSLNFLKMTHTVWEVANDGYRGSDTRFSYDLAKSASFGGQPDVKKDGAFGAGNLVGETFALAGSVSLPGAAPPIPEPQTWMMMLAGLGLLLGAARRR